MTKKEYDALSTILSFVRKTNPTPAARAALDEVVEEFCAVEAERNPSFKRQRFEADAGYQT